MIISGGMFLNYTHPINRSAQWVDEIIFRESLGGRCGIGTARDLRSFLVPGKVLVRTTSENRGL